MYWLPQSSSRPDILSESDLPQGEIRVKRVEALRWAERKGEYDKWFRTMNV